MPMSSVKKYGGVAWQVKKSDRACQEWRTFTWASLDINVIKVMIEMWICFAKIGCFFVVCSFGLIKRKIMYTNVNSGSCKMTQWNISIDCVLGGQKEWQEWRTYTYGCHKNLGILRYEWLNCECFAKIGCFL